MNKTTGKTPANNKAFDKMLKNYQAKAENSQYSKEELEEICEGLFILKYTKNRETKSLMLKKLVEKRIERLSRCK